MDLYIKKEDKYFYFYFYFYIKYYLFRIMREMLNKFTAEETWIVDDDERNKVLSSSTDLIYYFKSSLKTCSSLTKNEAFYDLYLLFKKYLIDYAKVLSNRIPR
jgi:hypothetical protein